MTTSTMEKIKVMLAFDEGKKIQWVIQGRTEWQDCCAPVWDWYGLSYRIKPNIPRKFTQWFLDTESKLIGPFASLNAAENYLPYWNGTGPCKIVAFEMTEILDNAER